MKLLADLHVHSRASLDGRSSVEALIETARTRGLSAITVSDHDLCTPLPDCKDAVLLGAVKDFVAGFYAGNADKNAAFRRRRHFITHNLAEFSRENIANYKTEAARPVSDIIIDLKVNKNILEENMLLCKNQSPYKDPGNVYILVYPEEDGYRAHLINLGAQGEDVSFFYKKA